MIFTASLLVSSNLSWIIMMAGILGNLNEKLFLFKTYLNSQHIWISMWIFFVVRCLLVENARRWLFEGFLTHIIMSNVHLKHCWARRVGAWSPDFSVISHATGILAFGLWYNLVLSAFGDNQFSQKLVNDDNHNKFTIRLIEIIEKLWLNRLKTKFGCSPFAKWITSWRRKMMRALF